MCRSGEEGVLTFNVYKGEPGIIDELGGCRFIVFGMFGRDVVACECAYCGPLCVSFDVGR
jgi:hypothetical protein